MAPTIALEEIIPCSVFCFHGNGLIFRFHDLSHTAATVAISSGADIQSVQDLLGHATASFTLNVYAHTSEKMMKDTAERMQSYYDGLAVKG